MRTTYCKAEINLSDVTARQDSSITASRADIEHLGLLKADEAVMLPQTALLDHNAFILDGSLGIVEFEEDIAYVSSEVSEEDCTFELPPKITITFSKPHTSNALSLYFGIDYPSEIEVSWYSLQGTKLATLTDYPTDINHVVNMQVVNYGKIEITYIKSRLPFQKACLQYITYGLSKTWEMQDIQSAKVLEEVDITAGSLSVNTASIKILDRDNEFNIANSNGMWKAIQKTQQVKISEVIDGVEELMGYYYISESSFADNTASFELVDAIGLLDSYMYYDGDEYSYTLTTAGKLLKDIFKTANITRYKIDPEIENYSIKGWVKPMSCREALQSICFACGCIADDSRSEYIEIKKHDKYVKYVIDSGRKFSTNVALTEYVSGVSIGVNQYIWSNDYTNLYEGMLSEGTNRIVFNTPVDYQSIEITPHAEYDPHTNYLDITLDEEKNVLIEGVKCDIEEIAFVKNVEIVDGGETAHVVNYNGCPIYSPTKIKEVAKSLLDYHSMRKSVTCEFVLDNERVGNWVVINGKDSDNMNVLIEQLSIDLAGGFIATLKGVGYTTEKTETYYTGKELYTGDNSIL